MDKNKIYVSKEILPVFKFLEEIEKEIESILFFDRKMESIRKYYREMIELVRALSLKIPKSKNNFKFNLSEKPETIVEKFKIDYPTRSKVIALFAYLETLMRLNFAYDNKISDEVKIRELSLEQKTWKSFYKDFCLSTENEWVNDNKERAKDITAVDLRYLRNSLTHFFSLDKKLQIIDDILSCKARKLEGMEGLKKLKVRFISPEDLYEMIKGAGRLMLIKWSNDCNSDLMNDFEFNEKISSVINLVECSGAILMKEECINIIDE